METFTPEELARLAAATAEYRDALQAKAGLVEERRLLRMRADNLTVDIDPIQSRINKALAAIREILNGGIPTTEW